MEQLDRAWSVVSHLNAVINSPELRDAYNANLRKVTELHAQMSQDSRMHGRYRALRAAPAAIVLCRRSRSRPFAIGPAMAPIAAATPSTVSP